MPASASAPASAAQRSAVLIGLIGEGVSPSLTPPMHELEGARQGMHYVYRTIELSSEQGTSETLAWLLSAAQRLGFTGLNITHPVKQMVIPLLDELRPSAAAVGAVNTVVFDGGRMIGHNTDVTGFTAMLEDGLGDTPLGRVVLVGAGGAGSAVASALLMRGIRELVIVDVDAARAAELASSRTATDGASVRSLPLSQIREALDGADGVVNATPLGMAGHPGTAFDPALLQAGTFVADIVYRPVETALLMAARERGCHVLSGLGMAMHQAADAFEIFTGRRADRRAMLADLHELVATEASRTTTPPAQPKGMH